MAVGPDEVRIRFAPGSAYPQLVERRRADVERAFGGFFGRPVRLALGPRAGIGEAAALELLRDRIERRFRPAGGEETPG